MLYLISILILLLIVAFLVLLERKILRLTQMRKRPNIVGFYGIIQTIADRVKLLLKKFLILKHYTRFFFIIAPSIAFFLSLILWFFPVINSSFSYCELRIFIFLIIISLNRHTIVWARWRSSNIYSLIRAIRAVAQVVSYEVVLSFFIFLLIIKTRIINWLVFHYKSYFFIFFFFFTWAVIILAELNRTPFDLVEGESELVRRYNVEFSRARFTLLFLAEYLSIWLISLIFTIFFLPKNIFMVILIVLFVVIVRAQLPRFKFIDLIFLAWKVLLIYVTLFIVFFFIF